MATIKQKCYERSTIVIFMFTLAFTFTLNQNWYIYKHITRSEGNQLNEDTFTPKNSDHLIFFHIPKTGGKVVEQLFINEFNISFPNTIPKNTLMDRSYARRMACGDTAHHQPINWLFEKILNDSDTNMNVSSRSNIRNKLYNISSYYYSKWPYLTTDSFTVVRNPYSRFISQYQYCTAPVYTCTRDLIKWFSTHCRQYSSQNNDALCKKLDYLHKHANFTYKRGSAMEQLPKSNQSIWRQFDFCDIKIFNAYAYVTLKYLIEEAYSSHDKHKRALFHCHYVKQSEYVYDYRQKNDKMIKYIFKTEHLTDHLIHLGKIYNITINNGIVAKYRDQWAWPQNCKNIKPNDLNVENKRLFNKLYYDDFVNFNYSMME
eukprot:426173_1